MHLLHRFGLTGICVGLGLSACSSPQPSFEVSVDEGSVQLGSSSQVQVAVRIQLQIGFSQPVSFELPDPPAGISGSFDEVNASSAKLTLSIARTINPGTYSLTVRAKSANLSREAKASLKVLPPVVAADVKTYLPRDFSSGVLNVQLDAVAPWESVAVIPVYASQDSPTDSPAGPDGQRYTLEVSGVAPLTSQRESEAQHHDEHEHEHAAHMRQLEEGQQHAERLLNAGLRPLSQGGVRSSAIGDRCPPPYVVGTTQCQLYVGWLSNKQLVNTTLRHTSASAYWFVQNEDSADFSAQELADLAQKYEEVGVPTVRRYFGEIPDVDRNGKIIIVFSRAVTEVGGYAGTPDFFPREPTQNPFSNEGDFFYIRPPSTSSRSRADYFSSWAPSTTVHELKHMVSYFYRLQNRRWENSSFEEGSARAAELLAGLGTVPTEIVASDARRFLTGTRDFRIRYTSLPQESNEARTMYSSNLLFLWRIAERVGHDNFWRRWTTSGNNGKANLEAVAGQPFEQLMLDFSSTLLFDKTGLIPNNPFDYQSLNLRGPDWKRLGYLPLQSGTHTVRSMAYFLGKGTDQNVRITVRSPEAKPYVVVVRFNGNLPWTIVPEGISGTVLAPPGGDVRGTLVRACLVVEGTTDNRCERGENYTLEIQGTGSIAPFSFPNLVKGNYIVFADKDVDGNGFRKTGDYHVCYNRCQRVTPPATGLNLNLSVWP